MVAAAEAASFGDFEEAPTDGAGGTRGRAGDGRAGTCLPACLPELQYHAFQTSYSYRSI